MSGLLDLIARQQAKQSICGWHAFVGRQNPWCNRRKRHKREINNGVFPVAVARRSSLRMKTETRLPVVSLQPA